MRKGFKRNHCEILVSKPRRFTPKIARNCRRRENLINFEEKSIIEALNLKHRYRIHSIVEYENELNLKFFHFETKIVYLPSLTDAVLITVLAYWYRIKSRRRGSLPSSKQQRIRRRRKRTLRLRINTLRGTRKTVHCICRKTFSSWRQKGVARKEARLSIRLFHILRNKGDVKKSIIEDNLSQ